MTRWRCKSCGGEWDDDQPGGYYHECPPGTANPRNENIDDRNWKPKNIKESKKPRPIKAKGKGRETVK